MRILEFLSAPQAPAGSFGLVGNHARDGDAWQRRKTVRPTRSIVLASTAGLICLFSLGTVAAQDVTNYSETSDPLAFAPAAEPVDAPVLQDSAMGQSIDVEALADMRGGADIVENDVLLEGRVEDNTANRVVTGNNALGGGSFVNSNGINTVIQNTGANVLIQNGMIVNVQFADPTP
ncbi:hypothetical protein MNR01_02650 [Lysobacter sp. S4-A87]|uniref:hypothetical protein n=1 Tax=Lysobacter sp. S4-A87 TaxID=2925843 RepID=UPI001F53BA82|nr:hypothetical protein [Lysobacter sp. S4-A87]UNK49958.1 hypothetical protein MNR01_02650 [Lysobacter sp. S4-A87]